MNYRNGQPSPDSKTDSRHGRQQEIPVDPGRIPIGLWSARKAIIDICRRVMPVEGFGTCTALPLASIGFTAGFTTCTLPSCRALTGALTGTGRLPPKRFVDLVHRLLLHRR